MADKRTGAEQLRDTARAFGINSTAFWATAARLAQEEPAFEPVLLYEAAPESNDPNKDMAVNAGRDAESPEGAVYVGGVAYSPDKALLLATAITEAARAVYEDREHPQDGWQEYAKHPACCERYGEGHDPKFAVSGCKGVKQGG